MADDTAAETAAQLAESVGEAPQDSSLANIAQSQADGIEFDQDAFAAELDSYSETPSMFSDISLGSITNSLSSMRLGAAGLLSSAGSALSGLFGGGSTPTIPTWMDNSYSAGPIQSSGGTEDWRLKVTVSPSVPWMSAPILAPIKESLGVTFPILPTVTVVHTAKYDSQSLTHSNYAVMFYQGSEVSEIQINGEFVVQNITDGKYLLAAIHFFRLATKMFWGTDELAGTPPPLLYLDGFGTHYFPHVPCVLKSFTHTMNNDIDFIEVPTASTKGVTRLPTQSTIQISVQPVYSRSKVAQFSLDKFSKGQLIGGTGGFI